MIKEINGSLPIWPYTWPQYHNNNTLSPLDLWERKLQALAENGDLDGFVIWGGKNHAVCNDACQATAGQQPWLNTTRSFLSDLYDLFNGLAKREGVQYLDMRSRLARGVYSCFELYTRALGAIYVYISFYIIYNQ